jgi:hypothetical protein
MNKTKHIILSLFVLIFLGIGSVTAQEQSKQTVIIKVYEFAANSNSKIMVIDPAGTVSEKELKKMLTSEEQNITVIQNEINKWKEKGFVIDGVSGGSVTSGLITTIILSFNEE